MLNPHETALLVIDVQNDYWRPPRLPRDSFMKGIKETVDFCRRQGIKIIYIQHLSEDPSATLFKKNTDGFGIHSVVAPQPGDEIVIKTTPGSFYQTDLDDILKRNSIKNCIITGMQTQKCCDTTTREASARNYSCYFVTDAVETFDLLGFNGERVSRDLIAQITFTILKNGFSQVLPLSHLKELF
ncbi:MAG: cysteine hydrolase [Chitinivibrionales bacterium]|nr:cysteine hydrolase [Chitinivibrionales bacterium]